MTSAALACIVFHQLQGKWKLERNLKSANTSEPSGTCCGTASFSPRSVTVIPDQNASEELLYEEHGVFEVKLSVNASCATPRLTFSRKYIWRLSSDHEPTISVWFTKPGTEELDYLLHEQDLRPVGTSGMTVMWSTARAHGSHLCIEDMYETEYQYHLTDESTGEEPRIAQWSTSHTVKGPKKDQLITTTFTPQDSGS